MKKILLILTKATTMKKLLLLLMILPMIGFGQNLAIGDNYQGGIVFYLDGNDSGLIAVAKDVDEFDNSNPLELIVGNEFYWTSEEKDIKVAFGVMNNSV